mmetsp:Transcript_89326/g.251468  ORF Transcript_89326/g.251468 Transcript_89326/m.251468 type:complete len:150 (-) Transcript_89326:73-522(-)
MVLSILPFPSMLLALVQFGYPILCSVEAMGSRTSKHSEDVEFSQWIVYWAICAVWMIFESQLLWFAVDYVPLFMELKLAVFLWLVHPGYKGAAYIWFAKLQQLHKGWDANFYPKVVAFLDKLPEHAKTDVAPPTASNKQQIVSDLLGKK